MRKRNVRVAMITVDAFVALSCFVGAIGLVVGFMNIPLSVLQGTPFVDFTVPALILGVVVGGSALAAAAIGLYGPRRFEAWATAGAGAILVGWMTVELIMIGLGTPIQVVYLTLGLVMVGLAMLLAVSQQSETPRVSAEARHRLTV